MIFLLLLAAAAIPLGGCGPAPLVDTGPPSGSTDQIRYNYNIDGEIWFRNSQIQLRFDRDLYCRVFLRKKIELYSINDIPPYEDRAKPTDFLESGGKEIKNFLVDYHDLGMSDIKTMFGEGKQFYITGYSKTTDPYAIKKILKIEFYKDYPDMALLTASYTNLEENVTVPVAKVVHSFFRMDAARAKAGSPGYAFWSFLASTAGGDRVQFLNEQFSRTDTLQPATPTGAAPFLDLWTDLMGMAIGELNGNSGGTQLALRVAEDKRIEMWMLSSQPHELKPKQTLVAARSFLMVHTGDYQAAWDRYNMVKQKLAALGNAAK